MVEATTTAWIVGGTFAILTLLPGFLSLYSGKLLRYPTILFVYSIVVLELLAYFLIRIQVRVLEALFRSSKHNELRKQQLQATNYQEWYQIASQLDESQNKQTWATNLNDWTVKYFSWSFLSQLMGDMQQARQKEDVPMGLAILQQCLRKNVGGIFSKELYSQLHTGEPKQLVTEFVQEIVHTLEWVTKEAKQADKETLEHLQHLLHRALAAYGRTALCLSGGGMMGCYHLGILKALLEANCLPKIISGASAGSLMAAFTCVRTQEELERDLKPEILNPKFICCHRTWPQRLQSLWSTGSMFDNQEWLELVQWFTCGDLTFQEAFQKTGRTLCITLSTTSKKAPPILLDHLTSPHVVIASAVVASACVPGLLKPMHLQTKSPTGKIGFLMEEYWDGSIEQDIPRAGLAEQLNCQFFIVAQCNPHLVPFYFHAEGTYGKPTRWRSARRGGYLLAGMELFLKMDMRSKLSFLKEVGAVTGVTANLVTQDFEGTTTIVPQVSFQDYFKVIEDPTLEDLKRYFQGGKTAAYGSVAMIRLHYDIARAIDKSRKDINLQDATYYDRAMEKLMSSSIPSATPKKNKNEDDNEEDEWEPIVLGSILQGSISSPRNSLVYS